MSAALHALAPLLDAMAGRRVLVVGDLMADEYIHGVTERISREAPVPVVRVQRSELRPGGAANAAANVASLGGRATVLGLVGRDATGDALLAALEARGVATAPVLHAASRPTVTKTRILAGAPGVAAQQVARLDREPDALPTAREQARLLAALERAAARADAILVSDYGAGTLQPALIDALTALAATRPVIVDSRYQLARWRGATAATPNEPELRATADAPLASEAALFDAARRLRRRLRLEALLVTRGRLGSALFAPRHDPERVPIYGRDEVVDVTGAGDTVIATFTLARCAGAAWAEAGHLAAVAAGIAVTHIGAAQVEADAVRRALHDPEL